MKFSWIVVTIFCFLVGSFGITSANTTISSMNPDPIEWSLNTAEDHLSQARNLEKEIERLEDQVSERNQEVARYNKKGTYILNSTKPFFFGVQAADIIR